MTDEYCSVRCPQRKRQRRYVSFSPPEDGFALANLGHRSGGLRGAKGAISLPGIALRQRRGLITSLGRHQYCMEVLRRLLFMIQGCSVRCPQRKRQRRCVIFSLGHRPRNSIIHQRSAESAIQCLNPRRIARRNQAHVCAAARGIPPGMCEYDGCAST